MRLRKITWCRALTALCLFTLLAPAGAQELKPGELRLSVSPAPQGVGRNLLANAGFEVVEGAKPKGWSWDARNTNATFAIVPDARTGRNAVRITNSTPYGPHIYGQLTYAGALSLVPGKTYTLSCYVKSDDTGPAWIGGGDGWWLRLGLAKTNGAWRRFSKTFTARDKDTKFPLMINTDGPTAGFLVDDVKLEEGDTATFFVDPDSATQAMEVVSEVPTVLSCAAAETTIPLLLHARSAQAGVALQADITGAGGRTLATASVRADLPAGLSKLTLSWAPAGVARERCRLSLRVGDAAAPLASLDTGFELYTLAACDAAARAASEAERALDAAIRKAQAAGYAVPYAVAALQVCRDFTAVTGAKREKALLPDVVADLEYLAGLCRTARAEVDAVVAGKAADHKIPDPPLARLRVSKGNLVVGEEPVMLVGGMGYGQLRDQLPTYRNYGFNCLGDDFNSYSAFRMITGPGKFDETVFPRLRQSWNHLRDMNLAVAYNPTLHYFPEWALKADPDITGGDPVDRLPDWSGQGRHAGQRVKNYGTFFPFAIESPSLRRLVSEYYARVFPEAKAASGFRLVWMMNEPTYRSKDARYVQLFRESLRRKFGTVERMNAAWGSTFASFDAVGIPERVEDPGRFDWLAFHQDQVASWFEWLAAEAKKHDPNAVLSNKPMAWTLMDPHLGIDFEREAELWEIPGCDAGRSPKSSQYSFGWRDAALLFDFQKSVAPDKPLADLEYHYVHEPIETAAYPRATYWHSYLHGLRFSTFWVWATGQLGGGKAGSGMTDTAWSQPKVAWGTSSAALDLRRLARYVAAFPGRPEVVIYFSRPSLALDNATVRGTLNNAYEAANGLDAPVGFVTDKMIRAGKLTGVKLLIVPAARYVEADVLARIREYAARGGRVVTIGECLTRDEYRKPYAAGGLTQTAQVTALRPGSAADLVAPLEQALTDARVTRPVRALSAKGGPAWPVECRTATVDGKRICYLIGLNKEPVTVRLSGVSVNEWEDLISGEKGKGATLTVKPLDVRLLHLR